MYESTVSTRWLCFTTVSTSFSASDSFPLSSRSSQEHRGVYKGVPQPGIHYLSMSVHCLFLCYLLCLHPCLCLLCVSLQYESHLLRPEVAAGCFFFFVTLYSWTTPFCSSSGGGCQETMMAVPLSPLSATVTSRGGALGAEGGRQKIKKTHLHT